MVILFSNIPTFNLDGNSVSSHAKKLIIRETLLRVDRCASTSYVPRLITPTDCREFGLMIQWLNLNHSFQERIVPARIYLKSRRMGFDMRINGDDN